MESIYLSGAVADEPDVPADASAGHPTDGSSGGGISATIPGAQWYDAVTMEVVNAITAGSITPDRNNKAQLAASIAAQDKAVYDSIIPLIEKLQASLAKTEIVPTGMIAFFGSTSAPNSNWLICDGRAVSRTAYADLFAAIGTTYGEGNGSTTFNLPYLIDRTVWGGSTGVGTAKQAGLPGIVGEAYAAVDSHGIAAGGYSGALAYGTQYDPNFRHLNEGTHMWGAAITLDASRSSPIYGRSTTVQPPALVLLPCIHV